MYPRLYGGPFYTSVPSDRVGPGRELSNNQQFNDKLQQLEISDKQKIIDKVGINDGAICTENVGVMRLRSYLEGRVEESYKRNVAKILPMIQNELNKVESKLNNVQIELNELSLENLKKQADGYRSKFVKSLHDLIKGAATVS